MRNRNRLMTLCILTGLLIFGLCYVKEAGVCFDEKLEREILSMNILQYSDFFQIESLSSHLRGNGLVPICESVERDHGIAAYYPYGVIGVLLRDRPDLSSEIWHLYTYLLFFLGVVYLYRILYELFRSRITALTGAVMLFFTPRIFADGMYNNKDTVLMSLVIVMLFYGIRFLERKDIKSAALLGISAGFACNMKVSGIYVFALIGGYYLVELTCRKLWNKRTFLAGLTAAGSGFLCYLLLTPAIWGQGFHLVEFIRFNLVNTTDFGRWSGRVLFEGQWYSNAVNPLPWYYLPKIILLTVPVYLSVLIVASIVLWIKNVRKWGRAGQLYPLFAGIVAIPMIVAMASEPNIYNGWRHFYFFFGAMVILAAYTVHHLVECMAAERPAADKASERKTADGKAVTQKRADGESVIRKKVPVRRIAFGILCLCILGNGVGIAKNGIYCVAYTNFLAGGNAEGRYETDYYGAATRKILLELGRQYEKAYIYSDSKGSVIATHETLPEKYRERIVLAYTEEDAQKAAQERAPVFFFVNTSYDDWEKYTENFTEIPYNAWGNTFVRLYIYENERISEF